MSRPPPSSRTNPSTCRSIVVVTGRCTTGEHHRPPTPASASMRHSRQLNGPAPVLILVAVAAVAGAARGGFKDLFVYLYGGRTVLDGLPVYLSGDPVTGLHFTYPPFAAVVMLPLALLPTWLAAALWTGASVGALAAVVVLVGRELDRPTP